MLASKCNVLPLPSYVCPILPASTQLALSLDLTGKQIAWRSAASVRIQGFSGSGSTPYSRIANSSQTIWPTTTSVSSRTLRSCARLKERSVGICWDAAGHSRIKLTVPSLISQ